MGTTVLCYYKENKLFHFFPEDNGLKLRSFNKDHPGDMQRRNDNDPTYHQLSQGDDLRLGHTNYHVSNPSNKDW